MNLSADVISLIGTLITTISVLSAFVIYRMQKRDEHLEKVRESLQHQYANMRALSSSYDNILYEIANVVTYSKDSENAVKALFNLYEEHKKSNFMLDDVRQKVEKQVSLLSSYFQTYYICKYMDILQDIEASNSVYCPKYFGLFIFMRACTNAFQNILCSYTNKELYFNFLEIFFFPSKNKTEHYIDVNSFDEFRYQLFCSIRNYLLTIKIAYIDRFRKCINPLADLVCMKHICLPAGKWHKLARIKVGSSFEPYIESNERIQKDFFEAKKYYNIIFSTQESKKYDDLVNNIDTVFSKQQGFRAIDEYFSK